MSKLSEEMERQEGMILRLHTELAKIVRRLEQAEQAILELAKAAPRGEDAQARKGKGS